MIEKEFLIQEYINMEKPMWQIAKENHIAIGTVFNYIKKYNIESRKHLTNQAKSKISKAHKGKPSPKKGIKLSEKTKQKMSIAMTGKFRTPTEFGGHKKQRKDGYISVFVPTHKHASKDGYVMEHILVMEKYLGRLLKEDEIVHHKNKIRNDNRVENLEVMTFKEHARLHMLERHNKRKGVMTYQ